MWIWQRFLCWMPFLMLPSPVFTGFGTSTKMLTGWGWEVWGFSVLPWDSLTYGGGQLTTNPTVGNSTN
ncbi:hypothetical protein Q5P01_009789 [Channa striata]|uniref:Uncharacterized protein n=1 Tax=Channa striata TaxID=64152 RepID=A0AA88SSL2_CHASR|nr:hypothetical protein Q5P01_009789 [Channa striata]